MKKCVGECIYCGSTNNPLTDEHVIPFGLLLDGQEELVLEKASCLVCQKIINTVETDVLKALLKQPRSVLGFKSRHKTHQDRHKARLNENEVEVGMGEIGAWITLPEFDIPHLGKKDCVGIDTIGAILIVYNHEKITDKLRNRTLSSVGVTFTFKPTYFARFIAKVAYGHFVFSYGKNRLNKSYLPDIILGVNQDVGCRVGNINKIQSSSRTIIRIDLHIKSENNDVVSYITFFDSWGGLTYVAHVGVANPS